MQHVVVAVVVAIVAFFALSERPHPLMLQLILIWTGRQAMLRFITFIIIGAYSPFNICRIYLGTFSLQFAAKLLLLLLLLPCLVYDLKINHTPC